MPTCPRCGAFLERSSACPDCGPVPDQAQRAAAAFSYLWIPALVFLLAGRGPQSRFVRFHSLQATFYGLLVLVSTVALWTVAALLDPFGSAMLVLRTVAFLIELALFLIWVLAALKAYLGEEYTLPGVGGLARRFST